MEFVVKDSSLSNLFFQPISSPFRGAEVDMFWNRG